MMKATQGSLHTGGQDPRLRPEQQHRLNYYPEKLPDTFVSAPYRLKIRDIRPQLFLAF